MVCTERGTFQARCPLQEMEAMLDPETFVRISRFELINMEKATGFDLSVSGTIGL
jgi:DNA-binding LytR/AlgR family response regulator